jgi:RNA polymerase sigma factor (sigma-70 family)
MKVTPHRKGQDERDMNDTASDRLEWIRAAMDEFQGRLIRFAARITGDIDTARDVVQDTFLRLCREDPDKTRDHLAPWLFRVCRNRALDVRRKQAPLTPIDDAVLDRRATDPSAALEASEATRRILALLGGLPETQREVLRLRFQEELSYKQISDVTNHSVSHVGVLIHTGLKNLRQRMAQGGRSHA